MRYTKAMNTTVFSRDIQTALAAMGYDTLTPVQQKVIPLLLQGRNVFVQSKTGSGKTASYLIPVLESVPEEELHTRALILAPTRELALQIEREAKTIAALRKVHCVCLIGGRDAAVQQSALKNRPQVLIATPGRLLDLMNRKAVEFTHLSWLVLDEADQLTGESQQEEVSRILEQLPKVQTALFSATAQEPPAQFPPDYFERITMDDPDAPNAALACCYLFTEDRLKTTEQLLEHLPVERAILFVNHVSDSLRVKEHFAKKGWRIEAFSSHYDQQKRTAILDRFRAGQTRLLAASDAAARGLDIPGLTHIIQMDLPFDEKTWIHRSGRSGHQGGAGTCISLLSREEQELPVAQLVLRDSSLFQIDPAVHSDLAEPLPPAPVRPKLSWTLLIRAGRRDKMRPKDIIGALCAVLPFAEIGTLEILEDTSTVTILNPDPELFSKLSPLRIKGRRIQTERLQKEDGART